MLLLTRPQPIEDETDDRPGEDKARPRKEHEVAEPAHGPEVRLDRIGKAERIERLRTIGERSVTASVAAENASNRPFTVVSAPQIAAAAMIDGPMMLRMSTFRMRPRRGPAEHPGLNPEEEGEPEDLEAAPDDRARAAASSVARPPELRPGGEGHRDAGEEEKERRAEAAEDHRIGELPRLAIGEARPAVEDVGLDHDEDREAAQHIQVAAA